MSAEEDSLPPAKNGSINRIPELNEGDRVLVETRGNYAPDRRLTVESEGTEASSTSILAFRQDNGGYVLSGYGTEYHLIVTGNEHWRRVDIVFDSSPDGQMVSNIDIVERAADEGEEDGDE